MYKLFIKNSYVLLLSGTFFLFSCGGAYKTVQKSSDPNLKYNAAMAYYKAGSYIKALPLFEELLTVFRGTEKAQDLYYYYAYCNYNLSDYVMAQYYFGTYFRTYPHTAHSDECEFMRAYCEYLLSPIYSLDQTDSKKAIEAFQTYIDDNSSSPRVKEANKYIDLLRAKLAKKYFEIAKQYYTIEYYSAASWALKLYIKNYPDSKYVEESYYLMIKSDYLYASNSVMKQRAVRYQKTIDDYNKFALNFPNSTFLKEAESYYKNAISLKENLQQHS